MAKKKKEEPKAPPPVTKKSGIVKATAYEVVCPHCKTELELDGISQVIECSECGGKFLCGDVHHNHV